MLIARGYTNNANSRPPSSTDVAIGVALNHVRSLDLTSGVLAVEVWLTLSWTDARLAWDPANYSSSTPDPISFPSDSAWLPDVELLNGFSSSLSDSLPTARRSLLVGSDGSITYARAGTLEASCSLAGLQDFPFDRLPCTLRFASPSRELNLVVGDLSAPWPSGIVHSTWHEYELGPLTGVRAVETRPCCGAHGWPVVSFETVLQRAPRFYEQKVVALNIALTFLSFGIFFTHPQAINRQHFSITLLLTQTTADVVVYSMLPHAPHFLWIEYFILISWIFCFLSTFENFVVLFVYWKSDPAWRLGNDASCAEYGSLQRLLHRRQQRNAFSLSWRDQSAIRIAPAAARPTVTPPVAAPPRHATFQRAATLQGATLQGAMKAQGGGESSFTQTERDGSSHGGSSGSAMVDLERSSFRATRRPSLEMVTTSLDPVQGALVRQAFRLLDARRAFVLGPEELDVFYQHMGHVEPKPRPDNAPRPLDAAWTIEDFSHLCLAAVAKHGEARFDVLLKGLIETRTDAAMQHKIMWQRAALRVDIWSQRILPLAYAVCLIVLFSAKGRLRVDAAPDAM